MHLLRKLLDGATPTTYKIPFTRDINQAGFIVEMFTERFKNKMNSPSGRVPDGHADSRRDARVLPSNAATSPLPTSTSLICYRSRWTDFLRGTDNSRIGINTAATSASGVY
ncbi:hypothetical protein MTP99_012833 [Tenebrio molitor]|nr:hypothetical protein MTP99_012833 [Tenebrio molitor]